MTSDASVSGNIGKSFLEKLKAWHAKSHSHWPGHNRGFTLLETAVVLAALSLIATGALPYFIRLAEIAAAQKTAKETATIQEAAKWYYVNYKAWPASVGTLQSAGFLNPAWPAINPWGSGYSISSSSTSLTVTTYVPDSVGGVLTRALPGVSSWLSGSLRGVNSTIPLPGQEASLTSVTDLANNALNMAQSSALPPYDPVFVDATIVVAGAVTDVICPSGYTLIKMHYSDGYQHYVKGGTCGRVIR
jgi:prepilin-type N-terminal cleavage/methylation domain-containing protein